MKLEIKKDLKDNNYEVEIIILEIAEEELELFSDFGSLSVNIGGDFTVIEGEDGETVESTLFSLGDSYKRIPSEDAIKKVFTHAQYGDSAEKMANVFAKEVAKRVEAAVVELKAKSDGFSGITEIIL